MFLSIILAVFVVFVPVVNGDHPCGPEGTRFNVQIGNCLPETIVAGSHISTFSVSALNMGDCAEAVSEIRFRVVGIEKLTNFTLTEFFGRTVQGQAEGEELIFSLDPPVQVRSWTRQEFVVSFDVLPESSGPVQICFIDMETRGNYPFSGNLCCPTQTEIVP